MNLAADTTTDLPPEDIYGRRKKVSFFCDAIRALGPGVGRPLDVLDFGCGNGANVTRHLASLDINLTGVDWHEPSVRYARKRFGGQGARFLAAVPEGEEFDVVVYADVLEHLEDPVAVLRAHHRMLRDGGVILGSVPNGYGPFEIESWLDRKLGLGSAYDRVDSAYRQIRHHVAKWVKTRILKRTLPPPEPQAESLPYNVESGHVRFFTRGALRRNLEQAGYGIEAFAHTAFIGAPFTGRIFANRQGFLDFNARIADYLPSVMVSGWLFLARRRPAGAGAD